MDHGIKDLYSSLLKELECPVCLTYMAPPILQCETGHNICSQCRLKLEDCPLCKGKFTKIRNFGLEGFANKMPVPCKNKNGGCPVMINLSKREEHELNCKYRLYKCAFPSCPWAGKYEDIMEHWSQKKNISPPFGQTEVCHTKMQKGEMWFVNLVAAHGELFWYRLILKGQKLHWSVQLIGPDENAYNYYFEIEICKAGQPIRKVLMSDFCQPLHMEYEELDTAGYYVVIHVSNINHLIGDDKVLMYNVRIKSLKSDGFLTVGNTETQSKNKKSKNKAKKDPNKSDSKGDISKQIFGS